jgi:hypothetical protein
MTKFGKSYRYITAPETTIETTLRHRKIAFCDIGANVCPRRQVEAQFPLPRSLSL